MTDPQDISVRFDQLVTGDRIYWRGAYEDTAEVLHTRAASLTDNGRPEVKIRFTGASTGKTHTAYLTWEGWQAVWLAAEETT